MRRLSLFLLLLVPLAAHAASPPNQATASIPPRPTARSLPRVAGPAGAPLVVVDAGHGGHDPGSNRGRWREKDCALAIARAIRDAIVADGRVRVALTRGDDRFLILADRREIARRLNADLFISVHADSAPNVEARGASIYTLSEVSSDKVAARLAAKENKADIINGVNFGRAPDDVSSILIDLARRETMNASSRFADVLQRALAPVVSFKSMSHKFAGFMVLKAPDVPSVLFETGYISNAEDQKLLFSKDYQRDIAEGVTRAVDTYFAGRLKPARHAARPADEED